MSRTTDILNDEYFDWLCSFVCRNKRVGAFSYEKLLSQLHETTFKAIIPRDENRAEDGMDLRYRFALEHDDCSVNLIMDVLAGPCSVLEMMVALAICCEETYMDNPNIGNRTGQWFWNMVKNLGLGSMNDNEFDGRRVYISLERFMRREYDPDGKGGLFRIKYCDRDLRDVEIWHQLCWYLDSIV